MSPQHWRTTALKAAALMACLLLLPTAANATERSISYQFGATTANAGGQAAVAVRYRTGDWLFAAFTAPRSAARGRIGLLAGTRVVHVPLTSWLSVYTDLSAGISSISATPYTEEDGAQSDSLHTSLAAEALWGLRLGWLRVDIASHLYADPFYQRNGTVKPWSFPFWLGAEITW